MWWFVGLAVGALVVRATRKQMKEDEQRRKEAFERFVRNFPGWGE
jgi:uncharacterized membrane-anchored protein YhcB (DUF1043 family)